jgi:hypothetical protein
MQNADKGPPLKSDTNPIRIRIHNSACQCHARVEQVLVMPEDAYVGTGNTGTNC